MSDSRLLSSRKNSRSWVRRIGLLAMVGLIMAGTLASLDAEARRMGGGRTFGRQSTTAQRQTTPPAQPAQPTQQSAQPAQPKPAPAAAPTPAPTRSRWLGPIAGLAAGLGIAALLSHFGLGEAFAGALANFIVIALIAMVVIWLIRKFVARRRNAGVPANFDAEAFVRNAKVYFVRLQAAWDVGNMEDIREFTTPEMFAEVKVDLASRGAESNQTDVVQLNAELLGVEDRGTEYLASVRFSGLIRETAGAAAEPFVEIWNLSKSTRTGEGWLLAGIQQVAQH